MPPNSSGKHNRNPCAIATLRSINFGIFAHIASQVILNIAVVLNLIPTTGITLPFVSYGGTSVFLLMAEMAIALSVSRRIRFRTRAELDLWGEYGDFEEI